MAFIFKAPVGIDKVANFVSDLKRDFYRIWGHVNDTTFVTRPWTSEELSGPYFRKAFSDSRDVPQMMQLYEQLAREGSLVRYASSPLEAALTVVSVDTGNSESDELKTRIVNISKMREILTAEGHFPDPMKEYFILTSVVSPDRKITDHRTGSARTFGAFHDEWAEFRDTNLRRAQENMRKQMAYASIGRDMMIFNP